jgi:hypothetical protein
MDTTLDYSTAALALFTFVLAVSTVLMARATIKLANESREGSLRQISELREASFREIGIQTWLEMTKRFDSEEMLEERSKLAQKYALFPQSPNYEFFSEKVLNFFEDVGTLYREGYINPKLTKDTFGFYASRWWEVLKGYVDYARKLRGEDKSLFECFEKLVETMREPNETINVDETKRFLQEERTLVPITSILGRHST